MLKKIVRCFCKTAALYVLCTILVANAVPTYATPVMRVYEKAEKTKRPQMKNLKPLLCV